MELQCESCQTPLDGQPVTQLLCGHRYHTLCFLQNLEVAIAGEIIEQIQCDACHQYLLFQDQEGDAEDVEQQEEEQYGPENNPDLPEQPQTPIQTERQRIHALWDSNKEFKKDLKTYMKAEREISKPRLAFQKLLAAKKTELKQVYLPIKLRLEGIYNTKKDELMESNECKAYRKASARSQRYYSIIHNKYNLPNSAFRYLREKRGCKRLHRPYRRWCSTPQYMIRRAIRFRFRYW